MRIGNCKRIAASNNEVKATSGIGQSHQFFLAGADGGLTTPNPSRALVWWPIRSIGFLAGFGAAEGAGLVSDSGCFSPSAVPFVLPGDAPWSLALVVATVDTAANPARPLDGCAMNILRMQCDGLKVQPTLCALHSVR